MAINKTPAQRGRRYASLQEAADYLGFKNTRSVREAIAAGKFPGYRLNSRVIRVDLDEVDEAMEPFGGAPPLTDEQRTRLAELLRPVRRPAAPVDRNAVVQQRMPSTSAPPGHTTPTVSGGSAAPTNGGAA